MEEQLVSLEVAKLLKKKGFNIATRTLYNIKVKLPSTGVCCFNWNYKKNSIAVSAPTQSLAQKWLRECKGTHITIFSQSQESWMFRVTKKGQTLTEGIYGEDYNTYEEALEEGLKRSIKTYLNGDNN